MDTTLAFRRHLRGESLKGKHLAVITALLAFSPACHQPASSVEQAESFDTEDEDEAAVFSLTLAETISVADANDCKDINAVLVFDVENYPMNAFERVELDQAAMTTLRDAFAEGFFHRNIEDALVIKSQYEHAENALISDLALTQEEFGDELYFGSCHDLEVTKHLGLGIYEGNLEALTASRGKSHVTMGLLEGFDASTYDIHVYFNADDNKLAAFLIW